MPVQMSANVVLSPHDWVRLVSNPAGVVTNTAPTKIMSIIESKRLRILTGFPNSPPTISGRLAPFFLIEIIPDI